MSPSIPLSLRGASSGYSPCPRRATRHSAERAPRDDYWSLTCPTGRELLEQLPPAFFSNSVRTVAKDVLQTLRASYILLATLTLLSAGFVQGQPETWELRICAEPRSLPFSDRQGEGFENKIAEILARELNARLTYAWFPSPTPLPATSSSMRAAATLS